ncbi:MAG: hypothetical protein EBU40_16695, partial [Proteobacteria bacterium]|nr:hypothetical protein [Pseudomonadota bacterium]
MAVSSALIALFAPLWVVSETVPAVAITLTPREVVPDAEMLTLIWLDPSGVVGSTFAPMWRLRPVITPLPVKREILLNWVELAIRSTSERSAFTSSWMCRRSSLVSV